jgi:hypothetical protein
MDKTTPAIHDLYPDLTPDELKQAEENIDRYLSLVLRITTLDEQGLLPDLSVVASFKKNNTGLEISLKE